MTAQREAREGESRAPAVRWHIVLASIGAAVVIPALLGVYAAWPRRSKGEPVTLTSAADLREVAANDEPITPIPPPPAANPLVVRLGERIFQDPRLSRGNVRSCSSCHDLKGNGASRSAIDTGIDGAPLRFNTGTVFNVALNFRLGWEGRSDTLQRFVVQVIEGPTMGIPLKDVAAKLHADPQIDRQFWEAYGHGPDPVSVTDAIAVFERSLVTPGSRFDRWLKGDTTALDPLELEGYRLFKAVGCSACHQGVNVGGNLFERHGIFHPLARADPVILRVPSLRNVAATAPYFHDGSAATLQDAVHSMACAQLDDSLTDAQVDAIVAFLRTLSGQYQGRLVEAGTREPAAAGQVQPAQQIAQTHSGAAGPCPKDAVQPQLTTPEQLGPLPGLP